MTIVRSPRAAHVVFVLLVLAWLCIYPLEKHNAYWQQILFQCFMLGVIAVGWNVISGYAGYVSLGQSAFLGLGAYTTGLMTLHIHGHSPWWYAPAGGAVCALVAAVLGIVLMRARGHSFVILTIAFLFILQIATLNWTNVTGGSNGITLPLPPYGRDWIYTPFYYAMLGLLLASVLMSLAIRRTKFGMGLIAIREDEDKAGSVGINTPVYKVLAFVASAVFIGVAGGVYAYSLTFIDPKGMYDILVSVQAVLAALLGGRGTVMGPVYGAFAIGILNEQANVHFGSQAGLRLLIFGGIMAAVVLFMPRGVVPTLASALTWRERRRDVVSGEIDLRSGGDRAIVAVPPPNRLSTERETLLEVKGLSKRFGGLLALDDLSFDVREGSITGLIGPNGSGKTTAFNLIDGMMRRDAGEVWFDGRRIDRSRPWGRAHRGLGRTFQITRLFAQMTVLENVVAPLPSFRPRQLFASAVSGEEVERAEHLLEFVGMRRVAHRLAGELSFGQQKLVELAQVLMLDPKLILLDEPAGGINPTLIERIVEKILELNAAGKTILIVEHNMPLVAELCDPVIVLARGRRIAEGSAAEVQRDPVVLDAYLGEGWTVEEVVHA
jgi:ABC-type branched-subunit amino acid transport system ATPase component/ABC-type branched-subunit amino acid transport system permease subunit